MLWALYKIDLQIFLSAFVSGPLHPKLSPEFQKEAGNLEPMEICQSNCCYDVYQVGSEFKKVGKILSTSKIKIKMVYFK